MKARIEEICTVCGLCIDTCPDVFAMCDDLVRVIAETVPAEFEDTVEQAACECPAEAIAVE